MPFVESFVTIACDGCMVNKYVFATVFRSDETKSLRRVEPLNCTSTQDNTLIKTTYRRLPVTEKDLRQLKSQLNLSLTMTAEKPRNGRFHEALHPDKPNIGILPSEYKARRVAFNLNPTLSTVRLQSTTGCFRRI